MKEYRTLFQVRLWYHSCSAGQENTMHMVSSFCSTFRGNDLCSRIENSIGGTRWLVLTS